MKKGSFSIQVPKPCHEDWQEMTPDENGRFCHLCRKTVMDFTNMQLSDIEAYFKQAAGKSTCGRFRVDQLAPAPPSHKRPFIRPFRRIAAILLSGFALFAAACNKIGETKGMVRATHKPNLSSQAKPMCPDTPIFSKDMELPGDVSFGDTIVRASKVGKVRLPEKNET